MDEVDLTLWLERQDRQVAERIRQHGISVQFVMPDSAHPTSLCYTIGLFDLGHPELLVFGLDHDSAMGFLNHLYAMVAGGRSLEPGEFLTFEGHHDRYLVERVPSPGTIVFLANRHYRRPWKLSVPVYQLTWTVNGAFPWESRYPYPEDRQPRPGTFDARRKEGDGDGLPCSGGC